MLRICLLVGISIFPMVGETAPGWAEGDGCAGRLRPTLRMRARGNGAGRGCFFFRDGVPTNRGSRVGRLRGRRAGNRDEPPTCCIKRRNHRSAARQTGRHPIGQVAVWRPRCVFKHPPSQVPQHRLPSRFEKAGRTPTKRERAPQVSTCGSPTTHAGGNRQAARFWLASWLVR